MLRALSKVRRMIRAFHLLWPMTTQVLCSDVVSGSHRGSDSTGRFGVIRGDKLRELSCVLDHPWTLEQWRAMYAYVYDGEINDWDMIREVESILEKLLGMSVTRDVIEVEMSRPHTPSHAVLIPRSGGDSSGLVYSASGAPSDVPAPRADA